MVNFIPQNQGFHQCPALHVEDGLQVAQQEPAILLQLLLTPPLALSTPTLSPPTLTLSPPHPSLSLPHPPLLAFPTSCPGVLG